MERIDLINYWNYFLSVEKDLDCTSQFVEPLGQENTYSFEFAKILILSCTEVESLFKEICSMIENRQVQGCMDTYKACILTAYPKITTATVSVSRWGKTIQPFEGWDLGPLPWWKDYQVMKHSRAYHFEAATYSNAVYALSALYILIFYAAKIANFDFPNTKSIYIDSEYENTNMLFGPIKPLPDFETADE